jgi:hypothetical protein
MKKRRKKANKENEKISVDHFKKEVADVNSWLDVPWKNKINFFISHPIVKYYSKNPQILLKNRIIMFSLWLKRVIYRDINYFDNIYSNTPIDVVIVAADKDYDILPFVIDSVRINVKHPIGEILVISPKSKNILTLCKNKKCLFIDESTVLPITKKNIRYTANGINRSGWLFQQLLKWGSEKYVKNDYFLIADADTVFSRPQVFVYKNKVILSVCHQLCHIPYFDMYKKLLGVEIKPLINFTSHHMLLKKTILSELKNKIEKHSGVHWYKAIIDRIDHNEASFVSDYEIYGQYFYSKYSNKSILEHWFNLSRGRSDYSYIISKILAENRQRYKTISFHSWKK